MYYDNIHPSFHTDTREHTHTHTINIMGRGHEVLMLTDSTREDRNIKLAGFTLQQK